MEAFNLLPDPQTNGGLLIAANNEAALREMLLANGLSQHLTPVGRCVAKKAKVVYVLP